MVNSFTTKFASVLCLVKPVAFAVCLLVDLFSFFHSCLGIAASAHHFVWKLQLLQPADTGSLPVSAGRSARILLATQGR